MKLTTGILIMGMAATAWGQNPDAIQNTRDTMHAVQQKKQLDSNAALAASEGATPQTASAPASSPASSQASAGAHDPFAKQKVSSGPRVAQAHRAARSKTKVVSTSRPRSRERNVSVENQGPAEKAPSDRPVTMAGRRDPFLSPVVNQTMVGSGCSTGKRCLAIDQIALKGVVKSDGGMIAVVVNGLDKAYFLRENDPVFNGYVVKITGDSIVFKETVQDKIGHPFTREVTKKITTPAV
jgi:Tfp pilus assembly protein PilP